MKIRRKLQLFSLATVAAMTTAILVSTIGLNKAMEAEDLSHRSERAVQSITEIKASALSTIQLDATSDDTKKIFSDAERNIEKWGTVADSMFVSAAHRDRFRAVIAKWTDYDRKSREIMDLATRDAKAAADQTMSVYHSNFLPFQVDLNQLSGDLDALSAEERARAQTVVDTLFVTELSVMIAGMLFICGMVFLLSRSLNHGVEALQAAIGGISETRDFTMRAPVQSDDEIGQTATAFNHLIARVSSVLLDVLGSSESASAATREIAVGNADLSSRTEAQAASLEQSAASMEELTATVAQNAENARVASSLAADASSVAQTAHRVVESMVATMSDISRHSTRIGEITALIDGIAFQTNILALNAAVEAARAGDQGRGFAVVAGEVRSLAQRASSAAKEIKELIEASVVTVSLGESQASQMRDTMAQLQGSAGKVADVIDEISAASDEQSRGITQVNQAVSHMDEVTQQNAALVEELSAASQSMASQMQALREIVSTFKVERDGDSRHAGASRDGPSRNPHPAYEHALAGI